MERKGEENFGSTATDTFISEGADRLRGSGFEYVQTGGGDIEPRIGSGIAGQQRPSGSGDAGGNRGSVGYGGRGMGASLQRGASEHKKLEASHKFAFVNKLTSYDSEQNSIVLFITVQ